MANEKNLSDDIKEKYRTLVKEKEDLGVELEKVKIEMDYKQRDVINMEIIQNSLNMFSEIIEKLSIEDQKELMQLLIKEIRVSVFDPKKEKSPKGKGFFDIKLRNKWLKVEVALYEMPIPATTYDPTSQKFVFSSNWLPVPVDIGNFSYVIHLRPQA